MKSHLQPAWWSLLMSFFGFVFCEGEAKSGFTSAFLPVLVRFVFDLWTNVWGTMNMTNPTLDFPPGHH